MAQPGDVGSSCSDVATSFTYACMSIDQLTIWIAIGLATGFFARSVVKGPRPFGLFYDMLLGLAGVFLTGFVFKTLRVDPAQWAYLAVDLDAATSIWLNVALAGVIGAFVIQGVLRAVTGFIKGKA